MSALTKPRALKPDATIAIVSPASAAKPERVHTGVAHLDRLGYNSRIFPHALASGPLYYAGTVEDRLHDLHAAFSDPTVDAILCTRGGWGSAELLPFLDRDLIRANPKPFIGYSDHTSLHIWLHNETNLITFYGPMAAADFSCEDGPHLPSWRGSLGAESISTGWIPWNIGPNEGLRILRPGRAEGLLTGGCISIYAEALGTPYAPRVDVPTILFLEDIHTKPYQWDRLLLHIRYAGLLDHVTGIVFGDMSQCVPPDQSSLLEEAILHALRDFAGPIAIGLRSGHVDHSNVTLPLGVSAHLDLTQPANPGLHFLEPAVTV